MNRNLFRIFAIKILRHMKKYENRKKERRIEQAFDFLAIRFVDIFKDVVINRDNIDGLTNALYNVATIAVELDSSIDIELAYEFELYEKRFPEIWASFEYKSRSFIIVAYGNMKPSEAGVIYDEGEIKRCFSGKIKDVVKHIMDIISGKKFPDDNEYIITPYTRFLATTECNNGIGAQHKMLKLLGIPNVEEFVSRLDIETEFFSTMEEFVRFLWERLYFVLMASFEKKKNGFVIKFKEGNDACTIIFDPASPGTSGVKCTTLTKKDGELITRVIDNRRELECFINEQTGITYKNFK